MAEKIAVSLNDIREIARLIKEMGAQKAVITIQPDGRLRGWVPLMNRDVTSREDRVIINDCDKNSAEDLVAIIIAKINSHPQYQVEEPC